MAEQTIAAPQRTDTSMTIQEGTRALERYTTPAVDIYETADGLIVLADVPGVEKDGLDIEVKNDILTLEAKVKAHKSTTPIYREFELLSFFRQFQISNAIDPARISAELKHGVLQINLPKAEAVKPKKIEVTVAQP